MMTDPSLVRFLLAFSIALTVLCPLAWWAIRYDQRREAEWPVRVKRIYLAINVAVLLCAALYVFGPIAHAAELPAEDWCARFEPWSLAWILYPCW